MSKRGEVVKLRQLVIAAIIALNSIGLSASEHFVDLSLSFGADPSGPVPEIAWVQAGDLAGSSSAPPSPLPFTVDLSWTDNSAYHNGDLFTYEVLLHYTGTEPMAFPTSADPSFFDKSMTTLRLARVEIHFSDQVLGDQLGAGQTAYGADDVMGSLIVLQPGDTVRMRLRGAWSVNKQPSLWNSPRTVYPAATLSLHNDSTIFQPVTSQNSWPLQLNP